MGVCDRVVDPKEIIKLRRKIINRQPRTDKELLEAVSEYDKLFFDDQLAKFFKRNKDHKLVVLFDDFGIPNVYRPFGENGEIIDTRGIAGHSMVEITPSKTIHWIFISRPIFEDANGISNGLSCNKHECLAITLEHELIHLLIDTVCTGLTNGHGDDFMRTVKNIFGHTRSTHQL